MNEPTTSSPPALGAARADAIAISRFAHYGRLSSAELQDPALSFPSQRAACDALARALGGTITCAFQDQISGARADRPGWQSLLDEAATPTRRFEAVALYNTSRLARDRLHAGLFERELLRVGVTIHYAIGGGDPATPEGFLLIGMQQLLDEFERRRLSRETRRGMTELASQGFRAGGRAPYGYRRRGKRSADGRPRVRLVIHRDEASVVMEIFELFAHGDAGLKAIAARLNRQDGPPSPVHVDPKRNVARRWAPTTIRAMLRNPIYRGAMVWNRLDFATARIGGGGARLRPQEEWVVRENAHRPIIAPDLWDATQRRFAATARTGSRGRPRRHPPIARAVSPPPDAS
jgi:DNA invertase Pin-like site-specific DNA recombinase